MYIHHHIDFYHAQGDRLLRDPKKYFVWEVYFCQKKYIFDPESSFSVKIVYELHHFWPLIFVNFQNNFTYNIKEVSGSMEKALKKYPSLKEVAPVTL